MENIIIMQPDDISSLKHMVTQYSDMSLEKCLNIYSHDILVDIIDSNRYLIKTTIRKRKLVNQLSKVIIKEFKLFLENMLVDEYVELINMLKNNEMEVSTKKVIDRAEYYVNKGFIHFFSTENGQTHLLFPKELILLFLESINEETMGNIIKREVLCTIIKGLANIYGVYSIEQLRKFYETINPNEELNQEILNSCLKLSEVKDLGFEYVDNYVVIDELTYESKYKFALKMSEGREYYMPTMQEVIYYKENKFNADNSYLKDLREYLKFKRILDNKQLDYLMNELSLLCVLDERLIDMMKLINKSGFVFEDVDEMNIICKLLVKMSNTTRKWINKGYKPSELDKSERVKGFRAIKRERKAEINDTSTYYNEQISKFIG